MQATLQKYIGVILTQFKNSERDLYPLSKNYPLSLFPIGNKKLIVYQLQALSKIKELDTIIIEINESNHVIEQYINKVFLIDFPHFNKNIVMYKTVDNQNNFLRLQAVIKHINQTIASNLKGLIVSLADTIIAFQLLPAFIAYHERKQSDLTLLLKKKKQFSENDKKVPQSQIQTEIDNVFIGDKDQILFIDMLDQFQNNGVNIPLSHYRRVMKGSFKKAVDTKIYIFGPNTIEIIKNLNSSDVDDIKPWLIQCLVENQTNKRLLSLNNKNISIKPLNIFGQLLDQEVFIKRISNKKVYQGINFDSLVRGTKQKETLVLTDLSYNSQSNEYKGCLIMKSTIIGPQTKITRSCIQNNCKIGKKVQILRSIIMSDVEIRDNCKIFDSVIASGTVIGGDSNIVSSYFATNCQIPDGSKIDNQIKISVL